MDDALELLEVMEWSCSLDVAELGVTVHGHRVQARPINLIARGLQVTERGARLAAKEAHLSLPVWLARELA